jgi:predicted nucleic acid-binding protein
MNKRLVDTSAWIEVLRRDGDQDVRDAVADATRQRKAAICDMVLLELWAGASGAHERAVIAQMSTDLECLRIDDDVWKSAHALAQACRAAGATVPGPDLLIAACAEYYGVEVLERDAHFARIAAARKKSAE